MAATYTNQSEIQKRYSVDETFFDSINSEEKAYFLGFLFADGTLFSKRNGMKLELKETDKEILEKFKNCLKYTGPLLHHKRNPNRIGAFPNSKDTYSLLVTNKRIHNTLCLKGCGKNKTFTLTFPDAKVVPENLQSHFIRGYFDGDGCISLRIEKEGRKPTSQFSMVGTESFLKTVQEILVKNCFVSFTKITKHKSGISYLKYGGTNNTMKIREWMYKDSNLYLERKYLKFKEVK